jgi:tRNA threonylcarbamoyladenosine biosynthesis protein TsaB
MWIAIDTTGSWCSVALGVPGDLDFIAQPMNQGHSSRVLGMVAQLLAQRQLTVSDLTGLIYGAGPGSFTGLRIACGVAQGMALGANKPLVGISATDTLAVRWAGANLPVVVAFDARMGEVYAAVYCAAGLTLEAPFVCAPGALASRLSTLIAGKPFLAVGNAFDGSFAELTELANLAVDCDASAWPRADWLLGLGAAKLAKSNQPEQFDAALAVPLYIRNQVALNLQEQRALSREKALRA